MLFRYAMIRDFLNPCETAAPPTKPAWKHQWLRSNEPSAPGVSSHAAIQQDVRLHARSPTPMSQTRDSIYRGTLPHSIHG